MTSQGAPPASKRIVLINRDFQLRYTRGAVAIGLLSTVLTIVLILFPLFQFRVLRFPGFLPTPFIVGMVVAALINFVMVAYFAIRMTHRIAGPMFSLVRQFRLVAAGRFRAQFHVRQDDELKFVIRNFNEMVGALEAMTLKDVDRIERVIDALKKPDAAANAMSVAEDFKKELLRRVSAAAPAVGTDPGPAAVAQGVIA